MRDFFFSFPMKGANLSIAVEIWKQDEQQDVFRGEQKCAGIRFGTDFINIFPNQLGSHGGTYG